MIITDKYQTQRNEYSTQNNDLWEKKVLTPGGVQIGWTNEDMTLFQPMNSSGMISEGKGKRSIHEVILVELRTHLINTSPNQK